MASEEELIKCVWTNGIIEPTSIFSMDEVQILDVLDQQTGTPYLPVRSAASPECLSSLLNWRTIYNLLLCCDLTRVPLNNLQVEIPNNSIPSVVAATPNEARTVEFSSRPHPPVPSCSAESHPPAVRSNKRKRRAKKTPRAKNSVTYSLPGEANRCAPIFDTHCHLDWLFRKAHHRVTLEDYLIGRGQGVSPNFRGCNAVFCDPPQLLTTSSVENVLVEEGVYGVVGYHPKMAQ